jgi:hypothetical protein
MTLAVKLGVGAFLSYGLVYASQAGSSEEKAVQ